MKYRVQVTVSADRLAAVIATVFDDNPDDPDLKVSAIIDERPRIAPPKPVEAKTKAKRNVPNNRQILVEAALKTGPKRWGELKTALSAGGLSESSLNSLLSKWQKERKVSRSADGLWSLNDAEPQTAAHAG